MEISHFSFNIIFRAGFHYHNNLCMEILSLQYLNNLFNSHQEDRNLIREMIRTISALNHCETLVKQNQKSPTIQNE